MTRRLVLALSVLLVGVLPAQAATLNLPTDITGTINQQVIAPLTIDDAAGIIGIEFDIEYDPDILLATVVDVTSLTNKPNTIFFANVSPPGSIRISFASPTALSGSGALFNITFKIVGAGADSPQIVRCLLLGEDAGGNEIEIPCNSAQARGDHFLCYSTRPTRGSVRFDPRTELRLADQFETGLFDVQKPETLCNPAEKTLAGGSPEEINDPNTHLRGYQIKLTRTDPRQPRHEKQSDVKVTNQLGTIFVDTLQPDRLLVPTAKNLIGPVAAPNPADHNVDHFKCYTVRVAARICENDPSVRCRNDEDCAEAGVGGSCNLGFPKDLTAILVDQFDEAKVYAIGRPTRLCPPVDKAEEGIKDSDAHLMCYQVKPAKGLCTVSAPSNAGGICQREQDCGGVRRETSFCVFQEKHNQRLGVHINNQFGPEQLDTIKEDELCVPSQKTLLSP